MERLAPRLCHADMFAGRNRRRHLACFTLRRLCRGVAEAETVSAAGGFVVVLLAVILLMAVAGRLVRKLFHFAGFGIPDIVLGIAVSVLKYMLVLSVLFSAFDSLNEDYTLVGPQTIEKSKSYKPVMRLSEAVFPFLEWVGEQVPRQAREQDEE